MCCPISLNYRTVLEPVAESGIVNMEKQMECPCKYFSELEDLITDLNNAGHAISVERF